MFELWCHFISFASLPNLFPFPPSSSLSWFLTYWRHSWTFTRFTPSFYLPTGHSIYSPSLLSPFDTLSHYFHLLIRQPSFKALQMSSLSTNSSHSLTTLKRETINLFFSVSLLCSVSLTRVCLSMHSRVEKGRRSHSTSSFPHFPINHYWSCSLSLSPTQTPVMFSFSHLFNFPHQTLSNGVNTHTSFYFHLDISKYYTVKLHDSEFEGILKTYFFLV